MNTEQHKVFVSERTKLLHIMDDYYKGYRGSNGDIVNVSLTNSIGKTRSPDLRRSAARTVFAGYLLSYPEACHQDKREEGFIN